MRAGVLLCAGLAGRQHPAVAVTGIIPSGTSSWPPPCLTYPMILETATLHLPPPPLFFFLLAAYVRCILGFQ